MSTRTVLNTNFLLARFSLRQRHIWKITQHGQSFSCDNFCSKREIYRNNCEIKNSSTTLNLKSWRQTRVSETGKRTLTNIRNCNENEAEAKTSLYEISDEAVSRTELMTRRLLDGSAETYCYTRQVFNNTLNDWAQIAKEAKMSSWKSKDDIPPTSYILQRANALFDLMEKHCGEGDNAHDTVRLRAIRPNIVSYNSMLKIMAACGDAEGAESLFLRMVNMKHVQANVVSLNTVLNAFVNKCRHYGRQNRQLDFASRAAATKSAITFAERAEGLFKRFLKHNEIHPNVRSYNTLISMWASIKSKDSIERSLNLQQYARDYIRFDVITLNTLLKVLSQNPRKGNGKKAESIIIWFEKQYDVVPNQKTLATLLNVWAKSPERNAAYKAEDILIRMEEVSHQDGSNIEPNCIAYTSVIDAFANRAQRDANASTKAINILNKMLALSKGGLDPHNSPNTITFNVVIKALANSNSSSSGDKAKELLNKMVQFEDRNLLHMAPSTTTFNTVISAYSKSRDRNAGNKAREVLDLFEKLSLSGKVSSKPDVTTYSSTLYAYKFYDGDDSIDRAIDLLNGMESSGRLNIRPDKQCYTNIINLCAKSSNPAKGVHAKAIFERMLRANIKADVISCTALMNACAFSKGNEKFRVNMFKEVKDIIEYMRCKSIVPNEITYLTMITACLNLCVNNDEKQTLLKEYFDACCESGFVTSKIIEKLPQDITRNILIEDVPCSWIRNVKRAPVYHTKKGNGRDL